MLEAILSLYPDAPIYTLFYNPAKLPASITQRTVIPATNSKWLSKFRKLLLPWLPTMVEGLDLFGYDLVISSSSCVAKGVIVRPDAKHICYLHSPMRYIWDQRNEYLNKVGNIPIIGMLSSLVASYLRTWDVASATRVDQFIVNSRFVSKRVERYYRRDSVVIHPPVETADVVNREPVGDFFLVAGALVSYKRIELAIEACALSGVPLVVAGGGPGEKALRRLAGKNVRFEISPNRERLIELMGQAKALLHPGVEDFGILPVEAIGCGLPVIAFGRGGALDYVRPGISGILFDEQTPDSLSRAINSFDKSSYEVNALKGVAAEFSRQVFLEKIQAVIIKVLSGKNT